LREEEISKEIQYGEDEISKEMQDGSTGPHTLQVFASTPTRAAHGVRRRRRKITRFMTRSGTDPCPRAGPRARAGARRRHRVTACLGVVGWGWCG
jgi:hypothetical protein